MGLRASLSCPDPGSWSTFNCTPCSVPSRATALPTFSSCQQPSMRGAHFHCWGWRRWSLGRDRPLPRVSTHKGTTSRAWGRGRDLVHKEGWGEFSMAHSPSISLGKTEEETPKGAQSVRGSTQVGAGSGSGPNRAPPHAAVGLACPVPWLPQIYIIATGLPP